MIRIEFEYSKEGYMLRSPAAALIKQQAQRSDITFDDLMEADYLVFFSAFALGSTPWYPQLMHYAERWKRFPLFVRAAQHKHFSALATITGITSSAQLVERVRANFKAAQTERGRASGEMI